MNSAHVAAVVANSVTAFAVIFAGVVTLLFCRLVAPQPWRWVHAYAWILITGIPTFWYHGFGETFPARVADVGTNLLLAWAMQVAALGDFYSKRTQVLVGGISGVINVAAIVWMSIVGNDASRMMLVTFSPNSGYRVMQSLLILNSLFATVLLYGNLKRVAVNARPLLYLNTAILLGGTVLAGRRIHEVDGVIAFHATWHIIASFSFIVLWAFNHKRFAMR